MRVFFSNIPEAKNQSSLQNVVTVRICEKLEKGSKILQKEQEEIFTQKPPLELPETLESQGALKILSQLNLPITKERIDLLLELFSNITLYETDNTFSKTPSFIQGNTLIFHKFFSDLVDKDLNEEYMIKILSFSPSSQAKGVLLKLQKQKALKTHESISRAQKTKIKSKIVKDYITCKALNALHKNLNKRGICFFILRIPLYGKTYVKISKDHQDTDKAKDNIIKLSLIINTYNLGKAKVDLHFLKNNMIKASITFEQEKALELAQRVIKDTKSFSNIIKTLDLRLGKICEKDFLFENVSCQDLQGINVII